MFQKLSFQKKIFLIYSVFIGALLLILTLSLYLYMSKSLRSQSLVNLEQTADKISSLLDTSIEAIDRMSLQVYNNFDIKKSIQKSFYFDLSHILPKKEQIVINDHVNYFDIYYQEAVFIKNILSPITLYAFTNNKIVLFDNNINYISSSIYPQNPTKYIDVVMSNDWKEALMHTPSKFILLKPHKDWWFESTEYLVISLLRRLSEDFSKSAKHIGYIEVQIPYPKIEEICNIDSISNLKVIVLNQQGEVIYPVNQYSDNEITHYSTLKTKNSLIIKNPIDGKPELIYFKQSDYTNWYVILTQSEGDFMSTIYVFRNILLITGTLFIFLTLFIMYLLTRSLTTPIREMRSNLKKLSLENLSLNLSTQTNNELILFNDVFNKTLHKLKESMVQTIEARSGESQANFLALQAQINPHFMYNVLMVISSAGFELGSEKVVMMCSQLSDMMRYIASPANINITIRDEIGHVANYLNLLKWRFEDQLHYTFDIDEKLYSVRVPKLIIQPIVENSYGHGLSYKKPPWDISIRGWQEDDRWIIEVSDNGTGFTEEILEKLELKIKKCKEQLKEGKLINELKIGGMGLSNIIYRLYMLYEDKTIFYVQNNIYGGAIVRIGGLTEKT